MAAVGAFIGPIAARRGARPAAPAISVLTVVPDLFCSETICSANGCVGSPHSGHITSFPR